MTHDEIHAALDDLTEHGEGIEEIHTHAPEWLAYLLAESESLRLDVEEARRDVERLRAAHERATRDLVSLLDQIERSGCVASHAGETTYECRADAPCGLCRLRGRAEQAERERDTAIARAEAAESRVVEVPDVALADLPTTTEVDAWFADGWRAAIEAAVGVIRWPRIDRVGERDDVVAKLRSLTPPTKGEP